MRNQRAFQRHHGTPSGQRLRHVLAEAKAVLVSHARAPLSSRAILFSLSSRALHDPCGLTRGHENLRQAPAGAGIFVGAILFSLSSRAILSVIPSASEGS